ncbi:hypothetical protein Hamer_G024778, partial [Homarus americanus]
TEDKSKSSALTCDVHVTGDGGISALLRTGCLHRTTPEGSRSPRHYYHQHRHHHHQAATRPQSLLQRNTNLW